MIDGGPLVYLGVFLAAAIEGEVVFVTASVAVAAGRLDPWSVLVAGALGGAAGDQFFFYACRGRLAGWLDRFPRLTRRRDALVALVRRYAVVLATTSRLLPGLRIAIPVACACANVPPLLFSTLNFAGALIWAASILGAIAWLGPHALTSLGLGGRALFILPAIVVLLVFIVLRRVTIAERAGGFADRSGGNSEGMRRDSAESAGGFADQSGDIPEGMLRRDSAERAGASADRSGGLSDGVQRRDS